MPVNMYSGYPQLAFNFSKNFSVRMHRSSLGNAILKLLQTREMILIGLYDDTSGGSLSIAEVKVVQNRPT